MYSLLQKQLLDDKLIAGQPDMARSHLRRVCRVTTLI